MVQRTRRLPSTVKSKDKLDCWLGKNPVWVKQPPANFDWLLVSDDLQRRLLAQKLGATGRFEVFFAETLADAAIRLRSTKPIIVAVEQDGGEDDLVALAERQTEAPVPLDISSHSLSDNVPSQAKLLCHRETANCAIK